jgi:hypothetical protein
MPGFGRGNPEVATEPGTITNKDRIRAAVRILLVVILAVRLARAVRHLPADIELLRTPVSSEKPKTAET